ncbi:MAG: glycosyltransferase family 1 protein [Candidatus Shapirobacteria bacterium]|nr:glycosyltransferase family 1 protein [Candidatus Shapirobacteria bacterium]MDD4383249.1 glycosyltransferase family 1 protein [Candidatus Shapirobacteria bacterium]
MKKHIVVDARLYGSKHTGIGRYTKNLLKALTELSDFKKYKFTLIIYKNLEDKIKKDLDDNFNYVTTNINHYSLKEQLFLPFLIYKLKPDLVHFTHFNKPILYFKKSVVTIHDLIKHFSKGKDTTTKNQFLYQIKYFFYLILTRIIIIKNQIIVPSNYWRDFLIKKYYLKNSSVITTHEAVDPTFLINTKNETVVKNPQNYLVYTGNLYPHKNIIIVLKALQKLPEIKLKIICARDFFSEKLSKQINHLHLKKQVEFLGYLDDQKFKDVYKNALALVHPSLMEGFSLTGLEAMALNCPVISSNSSCLPEIYGDSVLYFDPNNSDELVQKINQLKNNLELRQKLINLGHQQIKKYSWNKTAKETMAVYEKLL